MKCRRDRGPLIANPVSFDKEVKVTMRTRMSIFSVLLILAGSSVLSLSAAANEEIPHKVGQLFVVDDWDNKISKNDVGFNYFAGNTGATESVEGTTTITVSDESSGSIGGSLDISFDFTGPDHEVFVGYFLSLFGLTDTLVSLDGSGQEPIETTPFPGYFLDTRDIYRDFLPLPDRSIEQLMFDIRLESNQAITLKIELQDESGFDVFTRRRIVNTGSWRTMRLSLPADFTDSVKGNGDTSGFDWRRVSVLSFLVERINIGAGLTNPDSGQFLVDNLVLVDTNGEYPDLEQIADNETGGLNHSYEAAFLDMIRQMSSLYFLDFASTDPCTGGIIQDRSNFADLMTVGGVGFQLTSYVIDAERRYLSREDAAARVLNILRILNDHPQGPDRVGTIGYQGFFYHFLGIDGLRKQNFDFKVTPLDESLNTVELSVIDTALAIAGVVIGGQYFDEDTGQDQEIRSLAEQIYSRVNWRFMLDDDRFTNTKQFILGWKPNEVRDDDSGKYGRFKFNDDPINPQGQYASKPDANGAEIPATIDYYTDEGLLIALLAMGSPNPDHRLGREVWDSMTRDEGEAGFVRTYQGALFTYQFFSVWLDTEMLGRDNHPAKPLDFFENTRKAIEATRDYAIENPTNRATLNENRWGLSATEGPFDGYFAEAAPLPAIAEYGPLCPSKRVALEAEDGTGDGSIMPRGNASEEQTVLLRDGGTRTLSFDLQVIAPYEVSVRYSNDNSGTLERVEVRIDGITVGKFQAEDTGDGGLGWNVFVSSGPIGSVKTLGPGSHSVVVSVSGGDGFGVEIDVVSLDPRRTLEAGTVTNYAIASSIVHTPLEAVTALWNNAHLEDLNQDGIPELFQPRFGFADAFNLDIANAADSSCVACDEDRILRCNGAWASFTGFAIDHGPTLVMIDNYLENNFVPRLFMSHPTIHEALGTLFPGISINPLSKDFGSVMVGDSSEPQTFTLSNQSDADIDIEAVTVAADFRIENDTCSGRTVPAGGECTVSVVFEPESIGEKEAILTVTTNHLNRPTLDVLLTGIGLPLIVAVDLKKGVVIDRKGPRNKDGVTLLLTNCRELERAMASLDASSVRIALNADGQSLYARTIPANSFVPNKKRTKYVFKEKRPEKHRDMLIPQKGRMKFAIKNAELGQVTDPNATGSIMVTIAIGDFIFESTETWRVDENPKRTKYKFRK